MMLSRIVQNFAILLQDCYGTVLSVGDNVVYPQTSQLIQFPTEIQMNSYIQNNNIVINKIQEIQ